MQCKASPHTITLPTIPASSPGHPTLSYFSAHSASSLLCSLSSLPSIYMQLIASMLPLQLMAMALCAKQASLSLFLFLSLPLFFTNATAGRYFFNKMMRTGEFSNPTEVIPAGSSIPKERNISTQFPSISQSSGYGLYGRAPENFSPTTTDTVDNSETIANKKLFNNQFDNTNDDPYKYSNNEFTQGQNVPNYDERNRQYDYGMSDTRFLENGKYYYDVNARRSYGYGSETSKPMRTYDTNEYRSYRSYGGGDGAVGRYGNEGYGNGNGNENEYNSVLNENENKGENEWSQEEYIP
ncbi:hypothetical protein FCM35_KLT15661 [Carex littledalei]|uniref:Protein E6 n=1 Tax=Carex littledalei TaxID=544730 RepID=A0A833R0D3_9POAL|nr:hypothetical protein FCM35_KLT15661 [Carex littledalei]